MDDVCGNMAHAAGKPKPKLHSNKYVVMGNNLVGDANNFGEQKTLINSGGRK